MSGGPAAGRNTATTRAGMPERGPSARIAVLLGASSLGDDDVRTSRREIPTGFVDEILHRRRQLPALDGRSRLRMFAELFGDPPDVGWDGNPYLGLEPYGQEHDQLFFGRGERTSELLRTLALRSPEDGPLVLVGPPGSGKSSMLRAAVLPELGEDPAAPRRVCRVITPAPDPVGALAENLAELSGAPAREIRQRLLEEPARAVEFASASAASLGGASGRDHFQLVLIVDQLEELFTRVPDAGQRTAFLAALDALSRSGAPGRYDHPLVITALRSDFVDRAESTDVLRAALASGPFLVEPMRRTELAEAIRGPAALAGEPLPDELVAMLLDDVEDRGPADGPPAGALPLLSQTLSAMWRGNSAPRMTVDNYRRIGGVASTAAGFAEDAYQQLDAGHREAARMMFRQLAAGQELVCGQGGPAGPVETFIAHRVITCSGGARLELSCPALVRSWPRLRGWVSEAGPPSLPSVVSGPPRRRSRRPAAVRTHPAATRTRRVRNSLRRGMRVHPGVVSLICALLLTIGSAMVAQHHREARQHELQVALELALRSDAIRGSSPSLSARLALTAYALGRTDAADDAVSASLAGYGRHFSSFGRVVSAAFNADGRLLAVTDADGTIRVWDVDSGRLTTEVASGSPGRAQSVAFDDGGTLMVAAADRYGRVQVLSGASPVRALVLNTGSRNSVDSLAFGPDARKLATSESDGSVRLWDLGLTGGRRSALRLAGTGGTAMAFSSDGRMLAIVGSDGTLRLWDTGTGRLTGSPLTAARAVVDAMAFSPDGRMLATAAGDATVRLWDVRSGSPVGVRVTGHDGTVAAMSFSPDGRSLATAAPSGVRLWDVDSYLDPVAGLCDKVGGLSRRQWAHYVPERGYRDICAQPDRSQGT